MLYKTILQIDDDADDCEFFRDALLSVCDATYIEINNPLEALKKLVENELKPDLIILDINMPKMDGPTLLRVLRGNTNTVSIPVILFSTSPKDALHVTNDLNVLEYITKPCDFNDLKAVIKKILVIE